MSFDAAFGAAQRIAIIGGGISGLAAAYLLARHHDVTLYESEPRLGGHARTIMAGRNGDQPVDTGFIVFNHVTYPHLTRMFHDLDVPVEHSNMSFGVTIERGRIEYALTGLGALFADKRNLVRPGFIRMIRDILRFGAEAEMIVQEADYTVGELIARMCLGPWFERYYLLPFCGAIWSTPPADIAKFPARALLRFFRNHALLDTAGQHQWWTVKGGSIEYVTRLEAHLRGLGCSLRTGTPVTSVRRHLTGVEICTEGHDPEEFDQVIMACHSDQALRLLACPGPSEQAALGNLNYQDNHMILHRDAHQMPKRRACWASWVCHADPPRPEAPVGVTYWMNSLQNIPESDPLFVSLNPSEEIWDEFIYDQKTFRHPVFDAAALEAQSLLSEIQGQNRTWFAGAYMRNGFHEDGFASAVRIAREMERTYA